MSTYNLRFVVWKDSGKISNWIYFLPKVKYAMALPDIQLTLVISTSRISNNRLSRSENLVPA